MVVAGIGFKGFRTFALALIAILAYVAYAAVNNDGKGLETLALIAFGFFFAKTTK
jgi:hypothetical protein